MTVIEHYDTQYVTDITPLGTLTVACEISTLSDMADHSPVSVSQLGVLTTFHWCVQNTDEYGCLTDPSINAGVCDLPIEHLLMLYYCMWLCRCLEIIVLGT